MATFSIEFDETDIARAREYGNGLIGKLLKDKGAGLLQLAIGLGMISSDTAAEIAQDLSRYAARPEPTKAP